MKKVIIVSASLFLFSTILTSCRSHSACQAYQSKVVKVKADQSERSI